MDEDDICLAARKMVERYGKEASDVAAGRAELYAAGEKIEESVAWERIAAMICELQRLKTI